MAKGKKILSRISKIKLSWKLWLALWTIALLLPISLKLLLKPKQTEAWWNASWMYRKRIPISYSGSENLTEYQVLVELDTATMVTDGKLQSDCDDLRFVSNSGALLNYSIVGATCNTASTQVWVKTDSIPASDINVMMYYGNSDAQTFQDEEKTFSYSSEKDVGYILHSRPVQLDVISLTQNNSISHNNNTLTLGKHETGQFTSLSQFGAISAKGLFNADDPNDNSDMSVPISWAGTEFSFYLRYSSPYFYMVAPWGDATITVYDEGTAITGCTDQTVTSSGTTLLCSNASTGNTRISSDSPIIIFYASSESNDPSPLRPQNVGPWIGGGNASYLTTNSSPITYYQINSSATSVSGPSTGTANYQHGILGQSSYGRYAAKIWADGLFAVNQNGDSDGSDGHIYTLLSEMGTVWGSAVSNTDYISIASDQPATCTVYDPDKTQLGQTTLTSSNTEVYWGGFGTGDSNSWTTEQWLMECDAQVAVHYQKGNDSESGLWTYPMMRQFTYPTPAVGTIASEEVSTAGPVVWLKFDEGYGTTANDSSGHGNNGTLTNMIWREDAECVSGKCVDFDGSASTRDVTITDDNSLDFGSDSFSVTGWALHRDYTYPKTNFAVNKSNTCYLDGTTHAGFDIGHNYSDDGVKVCLHDADDNKVYSNIVFDNGFQPAQLLNQWVHYSFVFDRTSDKIKVYINGVKQSNELDISTVTGSVSNSSNIKIGELYGWYTDAKYDEFKIYPYAITADQAKQDYNNGTAVSIGAQDTGPLSEGLIGYWKMDEASWNGTTDEVIDSSGNGEHGTSVSSATTAAGKFGNGGSFTGANYVTNSSFDLPEDHTISMWVKPSVFASGDELFSYQNLHFHVDADANGGVNFTTHDGVDYRICSSNGESLTLSEWNHVLLTYDKEQEEKRIYINGTLVNTCIQGHYLAGSTAKTLQFAAVNSAGDFSGSIDEIRIYNKTFSANEVTDLYRYAPGPVGYWKMDEGSGTTAYDSSGNGYNGTLADSVSWIKGKYGNATNFDGVNDYINLGNASKLKSKAITISAWVYYNSDLQTDSNGTIFSNINGGSAYEFMVNTSRELWWAKAGSWVINNTGFYLPDKQWAHVAMTFDETNGTKIYANGVLVDSDTDTTSFIYSTSDVRIGNRSDHAGFDFGGGLDEIKFYDYARTSQQIIEDMNAGHPTGGSPVGSQLAYWKFDEGYGTTAHDNIGNYDGTLSCYDATCTIPEWKNDGKVNKALYFSSQSGWRGDYVTADPINLGTNTGDALTVSMWVNPISTEYNPGWIVRNGIGSDENYSIFLSGLSGGKYSFGFQYNNGGFISLYSTQKVVPQDQWSHISIVFQQGEKISIYVNGEFIEDVTWSGANSVLSTSSFGLGGHGGTINQFFGGYIDEVKIYSSALTADQVKTDYNNGLSTGYGVAGPPEASLLDDGAGDDPIAEWNFDENTGTTANDISGNGNTGTLVAPGYSWQSAGCKFGNCLNFDGTANSYADLATPITDTTYTVEAWYQLQDNSSRQTVLGFNNGSDSGYNYLTIERWLDSTGNYSIFVGDGTTYTLHGVTSSLTEGYNEWNHVAVTRNGDTFNVYVNGNFRDTFTETKSATLSRALFGNRVGQRLIGLLDHTTLYDYVRTPAQIAYDYNRGKPIVWYKMDECQGTTIYEQSGSGIDGTLTSAGTIGTCSSSAGDMWADGASGKYSASLDFDNNTSDSVTIADTDALQITDDLSVCAWVKSNQTSMSSGIFEKTVGGAVNTSYLLFTEGSNYKFRIYTSTVRTVVSTKTLSDTQNSWTHVCGTFSKSAGGPLKIYVNGDMESSATYNETISTGAGESYIGKLGGNIYPMNGQIDDVRIYNYALSADQVKQLMNEGVATRFGD